MKQHLAPTATRARRLPTLLRTLLAALLGAACLVALGAPPASACSCAGGDTGTYVGWADVVVLGTVTSVDRPDDGDLWRQPTVYAVTVEEAFKGVTGPEVEIQSTGDGASCALTGIRAGERYMFFAGATNGDQGKRLDANLCGGTAPATAQLRAAVTAVTAAADPSAPSPPDPGGSDQPVADASPSDPSGQTGASLPAAGPAATDAPSSGVLASGALTVLAGLAVLILLAVPLVWVKIRRTSSDSGRSTTE